MNFILALVVFGARLAASSGAASQANIVGSLRCHKPCAGKVPVASSFSISVNCTAKQIDLQGLHMLKDKLLFETLPKVEALSRLFLRKRFRDRSVKKALKNPRHKVPRYSDEILGAAENSVRPDTEDSAHMTSWMQEMVRKFSIIAVHLDLAKQQENPEEAYYFRHHLAEAEEGVYWALCQLHASLYKTGSTVQNPITTVGQAVASSVRYPGDAIRRHVRDFILIRDYVQYLKLISQELARL